MVSRHSEGDAWLVGVGKRSPHGSGSLFVSPHGLPFRRKVNVIDLKGHSKTNKAELWAAAESNER